MQPGSKHRCLPINWSILDDVAFHSPVILEDRHILYLILRIPMKTCFLLHNLKNTIIIYIDLQTKLLFSV